MMFKNTFKRMPHGSIINMFSESSIHFSWNNYYATLQLVKNLQTVQHVHDNENDVKIPLKCFDITLYKNKTIVNFSKLYLGFLYLFWIFISLLIKLKNKIKQNKVFQLIDDSEMFSGGLLVKKLIIRIHLPWPTISNTIFLAQTGIK